ncbi:FAD-dependent monooxygenase [Nocardia gipuzkoensis]|uniref:FAD-dependent monooxygenase n=1 Tax=Nocardia gipuzkoensis TaxID=2749991 RepID=UPI00237DA907|nr:FAD-dependent monooxygenase [Nocardia gipuzkoensis]MDE1674002.1 FAD-dependent monooxygenase [Nocardia gipuzkoensis]
MVGTEVLIAGAGPVGLTAAIELAGRGVSCRIVDALLEPPRYAKAVGIQPRTLEVFEGLGVLRRILDSAIQLRGQLVYVNGAEVARTELTLPADVPYGFVGLPQYVTERILRERLAETGTRIERATELTTFDQDDSGVRAVLTAADGEHTVDAQFLIGCDGAHSIVRKTLGLPFEGAAFTEQYMLGDVELDWALPRGYGLRSMRRTEDGTDDLLVCIPLPGRSRYRVSMLVPDELLSAGTTDPDKLGHGVERGPGPQLGHIQQVLDRLAPEPVTASNLRWSSVFRISHRIVDSYSRGRVFVAGDAAHIHPPTGAQGMNTGIQDAHNLAWKLALAISGDSASHLLDSYDAERRPVGAEVVGRTVCSAGEGSGAGESDPDLVIRRAAQLLIDYGDSPIVARTPDGAPGPSAGVRAPDATGLSRGAVTFPIRLFSLLGRINHTLLLYADATTPTDIGVLEELADTARRRAHRRLDVYLLTAPGARVDETLLPVVRDGDGNFAKAYGATGGAVYVVRPDGYLGYVRHRAAANDLASYLATTFR